MILLDAKQALNNLYVVVVLAQGILKLRFVAVHDLRPPCLVFVTENPTRHVFGFNHEDAVAGQDDVIDLCRAVRSWQGNIVEKDVIPVI